MSDRNEGVFSGRPLRSNDVRQRNERLVLNLIRAHRGIAQSEVVSITGLKPPTVFRIFSELQANGTIQECHEERGQPDRRGRRPSYYCVNPEAYYAVGVDFWSGSASVVVTDFAGRVVHQDSTALAPAIDSESVAAKIEQLIQRAIDASKVSADHILGIGVAAPGIVDIVHGRVIRYPRIESMVDFPIGDRLSAGFGVPVHVHNTCAVIALSEYRYRRPAEAGSMFAFLIRSGVGGAFIQEGTPFVNQNLTALEVGHLSVDPSGPACECGGRGCLESYLAEDRLLSAIEAKTGCSSWEELEERLAEGDSAVEEALREFSALLAIAATGISNLLNPSSFLVVTRCQRCAEFFAAELTASFKGPGHLFPMTQVVAVGRQYDPILACTGAGDLVFDRFFQQLP